MNGTTTTDIYEIRVQGNLTGEKWAAQFDGMEIQHDTPGVTTLVGKVIDQAALYGILSRLRDLALPLISVRIIDNSK
ncbi:MAG: hypothetical protein JNM70_02190 [Anaerolineae bacterium]|nr:hypothetical protein [Anaerolineae bacterium]